MGALLFFLLFCIAAWLSVRLGALMEDVHLARARKPHRVASIEAGTRSCANEKDAAKLIAAFLKKTYLRVRRVRSGPEYKFQQRLDELKHFAFNAVQALTDAGATRASLKHSQLLSTICGTCVEWTQEPCTFKQTTRSTNVFKRLAKPSTQPGVRPGPVKDGAGWAVCTGG